VSTHDFHTQLLFAITYVLAILISLKNVLNRDELLAEILSKLRFMPLMT